MQPQVQIDVPPGVQIMGPVDGPWSDELREILSYDALEFIARLERSFGQRLGSLLQRRQRVQKQLDQGWRPDFPIETTGVRAADWKISPTPAEIADRRVEITGPVDRKMIINALNSGAKVFMADIEDSNAPTWRNVIEGQVHLRDAVRRTIRYENPKTGKRYELQDETAVLFVRPRGLHLVEKHLLVDGQPVSAALFDFGLYFFHNAKELLARGSRPYFYLPKLETYLEARLWNQVFLFAQSELAIPAGTIKATVLIETILASFEMDEILYELLQHSAGLNCGRWDYIFSFIKKFAQDPTCVLPNREQVGMTEHFLRSYSKLLVRTCHKRGAHAMGGMAAQIPIKDDEERNDAALAKVRADKLREVQDGHDGTWVAHPALVEVAREIFDAEMPAPNQIDRPLDELEVTAQDLLTVPSGTITEAGVRHNTQVGVRYLAAWLCGSGCVPLFDLMEDAATAEICRAQLWQWLRHGARLEDGRVLSSSLLFKIIDEEMEAIRLDTGARGFAAGRFLEARRLFESLVSASDFEDFLTCPAYEHLLSSRATTCKT